MPNLAALFNRAGSFINIPPINDLTTPFPPDAIPFAALLLTFKMAPKFATTGSVSIDMAVEGLMADGNLCGNLFGAQLALQMLYSR
jgi:hypothetical protein